MRAEIIAIGTELLLGELTDTDSSYLASQLPRLGIDLYRISQVGDNKNHLVEVLKRAWQRSELILTTGGLGPTGDDLTREAIAEMLGEKLEVEPSLVKGLKERFARLGMAMPLSNLNQANVIPSAETIVNTRGTAPGWWVARDGRILVALPGPPAELQEMWQQTVQPRLRQGSRGIILTKTFKTSGLSEAAAGELVAPLFAVANPILGIYAKPDGIHLRLAAKAENQEQAEQIIASGEASIRAVLSEYIWGTDNDTPETQAGQWLVKKGLSLAVMEDYSGGWLTAGINDSLASPTFFRGGVLAQSEAAKIALGVKAEIISQHGAASYEVAQAMAEAVRALFKADVGISITGSEETAGSTSQIYIGIADGKGSRVSRVSGRAGGKRRAATSALFELRKWLITLD